MHENYEYLFPFEDVHGESRILLYGAGLVGRTYLQQLELTGYGTVIGFVDRGYMRLQGGRLPVYAPERVAELSFDYIVIATIHPHFQAEIKQQLIRAGVPRKKIVCAKQRKAVLPPWNMKISKGERKSRSVLLWLGGGIGDYVCEKKVVEVLLSLCPELHIDLCHVANQTFLKFLYQETPQVEHFIESSRFAWYADHKDDYGMAIALPGPRGALVDAFYPECFRDEPGFLQQMERFAQVAARHEDIGGTSALGIYLRRAMFHGMDCYSIYGEDGALPIHDKRVRIPRTEEGKAGYVQLGLGRRYITLNNGNGDDGKLAHVAKCWPQAYYESFVRRFHAAYPGVAVVQVGSTTCAKVAGADHVLLGQPFDVVAEVLRHARFHLDSEGGIVHLATQVGTKCIVLFGPTPEAYYGYAENIHLRAGACKECYCLYPDINQCARDLAEPECMYSITPELVMEHIAVQLKDVLAE